MSPQTGVAQQAQRRELCIELLITLSLCSCGQLTLVRNAFGKLYLRSAGENNDKKCTQTYPIFMDIHIKIIGRRSLKNVATTSQPR